MVNGFVVIVRNKYGRQENLLLSIPWKFIILQSFITIVTMYAGLLFRPQKCATSGVALSYQNLKNRILNMRALARYTFPLVLTSWDGVALVWENFWVKFFVKAPISQIGPVSGEYFGPNMLICINRVLVIIGCFISIRWHGLSIPHFNIIWIIQYYRCHCGSRKSSWFLLNLLNDIFYTVVSACAETKDSKRNQQDVLPQDPIESAPTGLFVARDKLNDWWEYKTQSTKANSTN